MFNTILADIGSFFSNPTMWIMVVLILALVVMFVLSSVRRKKYNEQVLQMQEELKPGTKVKTYSGFYGTIVSIKETTDGKVALLEMGEGNKVGYITVDINAIYGVDQKEEVVYDKDGNIIVKENLNKKTDKEKAEDKKAEDAKTSEKTEDVKETQALDKKEDKKESNLKEYETFEDKKASKKEKKNKKEK